MEVILGAGGGTANALTEILAAEGRAVRLVSRKPLALRPNETAFAADLLDPAQAHAATAGADVAYLLVGLPYRTELWEEAWPRLIDNVLDACAASDTSLVFLDNVYSYAPEQVGDLTEESPIRPSSRKGKVRARVAKAVLDAHHAGRVRSLIARSADFYGPGAGNSLLQELLAKSVIAGKRGQWLINADMPHSHTYVPDVGRALAQLALDTEAYGRIWHLPTDKEAPTARSWARRFANAAGHDKASVMALPAWLLRIIGLFDKDVRNLHEMLYQYDRPYRFDSAAFSARYGWEATPIEVGIKAVTQEVLSKKSDKRA